MTKSSSPRNLESLDRYADLIDTISGINYIIDRDYQIIMYSKGKWDYFAKANDGSELAEEDQIVGKSVLDFFSGDKVRTQYKGIYDLIFEGKKEEVKITAKCDAPEALRDNVILLTPVYDDSKTRSKVVGVLHQSLILKVEARPSIELLSRDLREKIDSNKFMEICSLCKNVKYHHEGVTEWISSESYYELGGTNEVKLEQTICNECSNMLNELM